jgi:AraC-like DNA-binding protein
MIYKQIKPHPALADYIDAYWTTTGDGKKIVSEKILPDGCVDIILNLGCDCKTDNGTSYIENGKAYLVGTMRHFKIVEMDADTKLLGIRFKPAAFSFFYKFTSLHQITDNTVEFEKAISPDLKQTISHSTEYLNRFFFNRLTQPKHILLPVVEDIKNCQGQISVHDLAKRHFTTEKQLERNFKYYVGISPKEFINLVRFQFVLPAIQHKPSGESLLTIAFEHGYYDHAHLANEVRRYTGVAPTQL